MTMTQPLLIFPTLTPDTAPFVGALCTWTDFEGNDYPGRITRILPCTIFVRVPHLDCAGVYAGTLIGVDPDKVRDCCRD